MPDRPDRYRGRRRATAAPGAHRAPPFARGAHAAPVSIQVGPTATAAVFGVTAAAVALGSAASGSDLADTVELPRIDPAADTVRTAALAGDPAADAGRAADVASRGSPRNDAVRALTTPAPRVAARGTARVVVATAEARAAQRAREKRALAVRAAARRALAAARRYSHPLPGASVTSCFGQRWGVLHAGIDFARPAGSPIRAVQRGVVVAAGWNYAGYGISVMLRHADGTLTHYAHMQKTAVRAGQPVKAGTVLGFEGSTGDSTGPHLHFEVHKGLWNQVNPAGWLGARGIRTSC
ncbi:hypothetical protein GCM10010123_31660 [Pilimelia anulata]|uniref:M23ase beta-sheet core domain-containing protein n=1 Tax=Pilimelia anulata TaxID=53371 RepID=A0A8J3B6M6_9ACTN|nr:M23 family metallopeptidase [Pilimelia anulata]GGJ99473.1 hypothetical protein GCM10010123_31660 [Pilimelia anulata]